VINRIEQGLEGVVDQFDVQAAAFLELDPGFLGNVANGEQRHDEDGNKRRDQKAC